MIHQQLLSLIRQKRLFLPSSSNNKTLDNLVETIDTKFTELIQDIKWVSGDETIIKFIYLIWEDIQKDPIIHHNALFLKIVVEKYDFLFEAAYNEPNVKIKEEMMRFLKDWYRSETEGTDL